MDVDVGSRSLDRPHDLHVGGTGETRVDAALQAHLRGAPGPGFSDARSDLPEIQQVSGVCAGTLAFAFGEGAKSAAVSADVRVVDVTVDDVGCDIPADGGAQLIGRGTDRRKITIPGPEEALDHRLINFGHSLLDELIEQAPDGSGFSGRLAARGRLSRSAGAPAILAPSATTVTELQHGAAHG